MLDIDAFPNITPDLIDALEKSYPIRLSKRTDTDWDRGVASGHQEVIELLKGVQQRQRNNKNVLRT